MEKRKITVTCEIEVVKMSELIEHLKAAEQKSEVSYEVEIDREQLIKNCTAPTNWENILEFKREKLRIFLHNATVHHVRHTADETIRSESVFYELFNSETFFSHLRYIEWDV